MSDVRRSWPAVVALRTGLRDRLVAAYGEEHRGYHNVVHLAEVIERIKEIVAAEGFDIDLDAVLLAAWFHDAVYDEAGANEERSAMLAERELADQPPGLVVEVTRLVRLTATHDPSADDLAGQILCDADLAILAADRTRYQAYVEGVRREYAHRSDDDFRRGRARVLRDLLQLPTLFTTGFAQKHWESAARANIARELDR